VLRRTSPVGEGEGGSRRGEASPSPAAALAGATERATGKRSEWTVDSLASESVVAWAEGADAGWEFWMAAARAGSLISRPGWGRQRAIGNALAGGAAVVVGVSGGGGEGGGGGGEHYSARRTWIGTVCSALRGVCLSVDLQAKTDIRWTHGSRSVWKALLLMLLLIRGNW
jgi:hypothetical protein